MAIDWTKADLMQNQKFNALSDKVLANETVLAVTRDEAREQIALLKEQCKQLTEFLELRFGFGVDNWEKK